jgi:hypothetical protein
MTSPYINTIPSFLSRKTVCVAHTPSLSGAIYLSLSLAGPTAKRGHQPGVANEGEKKKKANKRKKKKGGAANKKDDEVTADGSADQASS